MDIQFILMIIIFAGAVFYVGRLVYRSIASKKNGCASGCGKCGVDFSNLPEPKK